MSATPSVSRLVDDELANDRRFHPNLGGITRGGLANHYPMTILALHGLGASEDEVRAFMRAWPRHRAHLGEDLGLVDQGTVTAESWPSFLGKSALLLEFRRVFEAELGGPEGLAFVARALGVMKDGLTMGLFHPLIRLSFAVAHGDRGLIADALAYMAIRYEDLYRGALRFYEGTNEARSAASVWRSLSPTDETARVIDAHGGASIRICEELVSHRALHDAALPRGFDLSIEALPVRMREITTLALRLYVASPSLTTLHAVTSAQALAELTLRLGTPSVSVDLWARYWIWLTALYLEKGKPENLPVAESTPPDTWSELAARARAIPEVHLVKMAYSCRWLDETFGPEPLYKVAVLDMLGERKAHPRNGARTTTAAL